MEQKREKKDEEQIILDNADKLTSNILKKSLKYSIDNLKEKKKAK